MFLPGDFYGIIRRGLKIQDQTYRCARVMEVANVIGRSGPGGRGCHLVLMYESMILLLVFPVRRSLAGTGIGNLGGEGSRRSDEQEKTEESKNWL